MRLVWGVCTQIVKEEEHLQQVLVTSKNKLGALQVRPALSYTELIGRLVLGQGVLINTNACDLELGTGGYDLVLAKAPSFETDSPYQIMFETEPEGSMMKLRYTPLQKEVKSIECEESEFYDCLKEKDSLHGMPVVCCELHSQIFAVAQAIKSKRPGARICYIMTDQASLLAPFSENLRIAKESGLIDISITTGQAYGGDYEAITLHSALLAAKYALAADICLVGIGPGIVGTNTLFGHGGIAQGEAINAVASLQGRPIACLRISGADSRSRHRGISHHSLTTLTKIALEPAYVALPKSLIASGVKDESLQSLVQSQLVNNNIYQKHHCQLVDDECAINDFGLHVRSMGRAFEDDPFFFTSAYVAGFLALDLLDVPF